ncbi:MAG: hypothetical protein LBH00_03690 [Planctomycetaceae bacterium]|nr:hypothetical protein [Planctomycetaceae bacterium]
MDTPMTIGGNMIYNRNHEFNDTDIVFSITAEEIQNYATDILKRHLTTDEMIAVLHKIDDGIRNTLDITMRAILEDL